MTALIIGANGNVGQRVCQKGGAMGMDLVGMVRDPGQVPGIEKLGVKAVVANLEGEFSHAFDGVTQVVFTAGSGGHTGADKTLMVDLYGAVRAIDESEQQGIGHFVMISALDADRPLSHFPQIAPYMVAKKAADDYLRASRVPYTVLRPGRLRMNRAVVQSVRPLKLRDPKRFHARTLQTVFSQRSRVPSRKEGGCWISWMATGPFKSCSHDQVESGQRPMFSPYSAGSRAEKRESSVPRRL